MAENMINYISVILLMQLFYSTCITMYAHVLPADAINYVQIFSGITNSQDLSTTTSKIQTSINSQTNIPLIDLGALVFYSSNIILDLLINFVLAIPSMITLVINGICLLINIDSFMIQQLQIFIGAILSITYMLGMIQFVTNVRSRGSVL